MLSCFDIFFFFKQKTAYEMRISDWSSACALPICSLVIGQKLWSSALKNQRGRRKVVLAKHPLVPAAPVGSAMEASAGKAPRWSYQAMTKRRSDERREGKEGVRTWRYRCAQDTQKKKCTRQKCKIVIQLNID